MPKRKWTREEVETWMDVNHRRFYANPQDANLFVRKRGWRINWTFNLANPAAWGVIAAGTCILAAAAVLLSR